MKLNSYLLITLFSLFVELYAFELIAEPAR